MSENRLQKLLFSEYCDFEDMVLIESPFAQTTKDGKGIRQVHLGLTPSKLVLATDVLPPVEYVNFKFSPEVDPSIETFELIAIYPVECVTLSIYRTKKNQALKARFCNNKVLYFEIGGFENRAMFWNLWCEKVKFFCPNGSGSSRSETSVGTSTTGSTLYLLDKKFVAINGIKQLWCTFGPNLSLDNSSLTETMSKQIKIRNRWTDRHLYLGKEYDAKYIPVVDPPSLEEFLHSPIDSNSTKLGLDLRNKRSEIISYMDEKNLSIGDSVQVNRFGSGIDEGCKTGLFMTVDDYVVPRCYSHFMDSEINLDKPDSSSTFSMFLNYDYLAETSVLTWEFYKANEPNKYRIRHRRRYGLATQPTFLYGFGPFHIPKGSTYSLQIKRAVSEVSLSSSGDPIFNNNTEKHQLTASISHQYLTTSVMNHSNAETKPLMYFWTPGYRYRPKTARQFYVERLKELSAIKEYHERLKRKRGRKKKNSKFGKKFFCHFYQNKITRFESDDDSEEVFYMKRPKKQGFIYSLFPYKPNSARIDLNKSNEISVQSLKLLLKLDRSMCAWDFDSTTLAQQLTMIDKDLFLKIIPTELDALLWQQSSKNAPNVATIVTFSQRISCLLAYEILKNDCVQTRARLISRFINVADKCHRISNFQSCRSVLNSLQSPAIYRLRNTWAYVRKKHATKYQNFEFLCRFYRDPRMLSYQKTFFIVAHTPPFLPYIGDILARLLGKIPDYPFPYKTVSRTTSITTSKSVLEEIPNPKNSSFFQRFLKAFAATNTNEARESAKRARKRNRFHRKRIKIKGLFEFYKSFDCYEDDREENLDLTKAFLEKCQLGAMNYNFCQDEMARSFLLKARYQDDKENFVISLSVESPRNCYEPNLNKV